MNPSPADSECSQSFYIAPAHTPADLSAVARLFTEYALSLNIDLSFQDFAAEIAGLPGKYTSAAGGILLLARSLPQNTPNGHNSTREQGHGQPLGCVALRALGNPKDGCCEMKRLYIPPLARGHGLGRALVNAIIEEAKAMGYEKMKPDTLPTMVGALAIYEKAGFRRIEQYYDTPLVGTAFLERLLTG